MCRIWSSSIAESYTRFKSSYTCSCTYASTLTHTQVLELNHVIELNPHSYKTTEKIYNLLPYEVAGDDGQKQH